MKDQYQAWRIAKKLENMGYSKVSNLCTNVFICKDDIHMCLFPNVHMDRPATRANYERLATDLMSLRKCSEYEEKDYYDTLAVMLNQITDKVYTMLENERKHKNIKEKTMEKAFEYKQYENKLIDELFFYGWADISLAPLTIKVDDDEDEIDELERLYNDLRDIEFGAVNNGECEMYLIAINTALRDVVHTLAIKARR